MKTSSSVSSSGTSTPDPSGLRARTGGIVEENGAARNASASSQALFRATFQTLDAGGTVGVFPEGTSYNEPRIVQVKDGAAQVALEYLKWMHDHGKDVTASVKVVPVGIVYTSRMRYQSRVCVKYGQPIDLSVFTKQYLSSDNGEPQKAAIRALTNEIEKRLSQLTVNAPDWDTLHAATTARDILWKDPDNIVANEFVAVSQRFVDIFATATPSESLLRAKRSLLAYYSLLYHTRLAHESLPDLSQSAMRNRSPASLLSPISRSLVSLVPSLPVLLLHLPSYAFATLLAHFGADPDADETRTQFLAIGGILGAGAAYSAAGTLLAKWAQQAYFISSGFGLWFVSAYVVKIVLGRWHYAVARFNYKQLQKLRASWIIFRSLLSFGRYNLTLQEVEVYARPPPPPLNPQLRRPLVADRPSPAPPISPIRLMRHLLDAQTSAVKSLEALITEQGSDGLKTLIP